MPGNLSRNEMYDRLADYARLAGCIRSLSTAAELVQTGSSLNDRNRIDTVVYDIFVVIGRLAGEVEEMQANLPLVA